MEDTTQVKGGIQFVDMPLPEEPAVTPQETAPSVPETETIKDTEIVPPPVDVETPSQPAETRAEVREYGSKFASLAKILFSAENKEAALEDIKSNPELYKEFSKRFPEEMSTLENKEETPKRSKLAEQLAQELKYEQLVSSKSFKSENNLKEDEYIEVKDLADQIVALKPSKSYTVALGEALSVIKPSSSQTSKTPTQAPRTVDEHPKERLNVQKYRDMGLNEEESKFYAESEKTSKVKVIESLGGGVSFQI